MSAKEVIWLDTGQRFESTHEAAEKTGVSRTALRNALKKGIPCKGLHFCYADSLMDEGATFQTKTVSNMVVGQTTVIRFVGEIPEIVTSKQFLNALLNLESRFSIKPKEDGTLSLDDEKMRSCLVEWAKMERLKDEGIISSSDFATWRSKWRDE